MVLPVQHVLGARTVEQVLLARFVPNPTLALVDTLPGLQMTTCIYAVYDPHSARITIANAGHLPPLLVLPDEDPDYLVLDPGLPLGVGIGGHGFSETTINLPAGSGIVLFTDGLVERRRALADGLDQMRRNLREQLRRRRVPPPTGAARTTGVGHVAAFRRGAGRDRTRWHRETTGGPKGPRACCWNCACWPRTFRPGPTMTPPCWC
ncbi:hypothetical protein BBK14_16535 [Parafrankia soli]|uniref:PPM-type phosphatase domain-containing protein n=2 Tax=Parafrankia soli TaxID=2599596 RepID=A0A1S1QFT9_9ACTN|nr:hypothetical protein BBK14_16535 [Parafrankia soli]